MDAAQMTVQKSTRGMSPIYNLSVPFGWSYDVSKPKTLQKPTDLSFDKENHFTYLNKRMYAESVMKSLFR